MSISKNTQFIETAFATLFYRFFFSLSHLYVKLNALWLIRLSLNSNYLNSSKELEECIEHFLILFLD